MTPFRKLTAIAAPMLADDIDTDQIIPSREIRTTGRTGLKDGLFAGQRYLTIGGRDPDPEFVLNRPEYRDAKILLSGANFGCGSSREHAAWALLEYGFRAVVAASFNPIFRGNCVRNGIVPAQIAAENIASIAAANGPVTVDLEQQHVQLADGTIFPFHIEDEARTMLLDGLDAIELTLRKRARIEAFLAADHLARPWAYAVESIPLTFRGN